MDKHVIPSIKITALTMLLFGVVYPLTITAISWLAPGRGDGVPVEQDGVVVGYEVIGQSFRSDKFFHGRPSAVNYNPASTGGSNKGPSNPEFLATVDQRIADLLKLHPTLQVSQIPIDLVTASGGGLDPHISTASARIQIARVANARQLDPSIIKKLVEDHIETPTAGMGPSRVNVLKLNIALEKLNKND
ncbi:MAG: potassium-transporting ATPase subunit KdpC [Bacteroidetes bacterium]|nr:potassium-transporting ATPase subunit KdpC [Bacteroidota bacterium]